MSASATQGGHKKGKSHRFSKYENFVCKLSTHGRYLSHLFSLCPDVNVKPSFCALDLRIKFSYLLFKAVAMKPVFMVALCNRADHYIFAL